MISSLNGDKLAYEKLLKECATIIGAFLKTRVNSQESAEDIVQESLIAIHKAKHTFDPSKAFAPWLFSIARHKMIDYFRKHGRISKAEISDDETLLMYASAESYFDSIELEMIHKEVNSSSGETKKSD